MFYELAQLAISNLLRARARLAMTAGGVLVGTTAVILLIALTFGLQRAAEAGIGENAALTELNVWPNYGWGPDSSGEDVPQLTLDAIQQFWRIPGVAAVIPTMNLQGGELQVDGYSGYVQIIGIDPALLPYMGLNVTQGELSLASGQVIAGRYAGEYFFDPKASGDEWQPITVNLYEDSPTLVLYQYVGEAPRTRRVGLQVTGVLAEGTSYDYALLMPVQDVIAYNEWITDKKFDPVTFTFDQVIVRATSRETTNDVSTAIRGLGFSVHGMGDYLNQLNSFFVMMRVMLGGMGSVALLVAAFGVANTMTMAILERTKEIGLMKAIGATDRDVLTIFLLEAGLVGLCGGLAGVTSAFLLGNLVNNALQQTSTEGGGLMFLPIDPSQLNGNLIIIPPELALFALALATLVGMAAGAYPALRAANLLPVIALKQE